MTSAQANTLLGALGVLETLQKDNEKKSASDGIYYEACRTAENAVFNVLNVAENRMHQPPARLAMDTWFRRK